MKTFKITALAITVAVLIVVAVLLIRDSTDNFNDFDTATVGYTYGYTYDADTSNNEALHRVFGDISKVDITSDELCSNTAYIATYKDGNDSESLYLVYCMSVRNREYYLYADSNGKFYRLGEDAVTALLSIDVVNESCICSRAPQVVLIPNVNEGDRFLLPASSGRWNYCGADGQLNTLDITPEEENSPITVDVGLYDYSLICTVTPDSMELTLTDSAGNVTSQTLEPSQKVSILEAGNTYNAELKCVWTDTDADYYGEVTYTAVITVNE